ncbi:MAG TPA: HIT family protein [Gaiellaceae bacterium]|nr:HIT family protein [Gaiellaceae bacterium]
MSCVFCDIVAGEAPASMVHEDERTVTFLDIRPITPGHLLVVPREHAAYLAELDPEDGAQLFRVGMRAAAALRSSSLRCEGVNFHLADGVVAGAEVFHVHLHVIPRYSGDGFGLRFPADYRIRDRAELHEAAAAVREGWGT